VKDFDKKQLWARSGNVCSFPGCNVELVQEKRVNRVLGEEAHIRGDKPGSARYDPTQSPDERESYENHILLCPNHHVEVDANLAFWTVERLVEIKAKHEQQMVLNRNFPQVIDELGQLFERYRPADDSLKVVVPKVITDPAQVEVVRVDASEEEGVQTGIQVLQGQCIAFFARGLITYDGGYHFSNPEGILCNAYGLPTLAKDPEGNLALAVWPHEQARRTDGDRPGLIGSLYGWIGAYSPDNAFLVGCRRRITIRQDGYLYLAVNDAEGTYSDNDGEFRVEIQAVKAHDSDHKTDGAIADWR
jgi:hypothetical protein